MSVPSALHRTSIFPFTGSCLLVSIPMLGFDITNDIFAENTWYFRNLLVRANYNNLKNGIYETTEFLEVFLRNLLLHENHPLHNRTLHICGPFKDVEKPDIDVLKADIENAFQPKTASHILKLREAFPGQTIFGRSDVMKVFIYNKRKDFIYGETKC